MNDEWLKANYDKALLVVASLVAIGLAGWLIYSSTKFNSVFDYSSPRRSDNVAETGLENLEKASKGLNESVTWKGENLFVSAPILEVWDGNEWKLSMVGSGSVHDPITDAWVKKHGLDITDPGLQGADPDGDNFTNLEEWLAGGGDPNKTTDPSDPDSHPDFITKVCLSSMVESDLKFVFRGQVDPKTWQIDQISEGKFRSRNWLVRMTETLGPDGAKFRLDGFKEDRGEDANGVPTDQSVVTLSYVEAGGTARVKVPLVRDVEWEMPTHEGVFTDQFDGAEFSAKRGSSFKLTNDRDHSFRVIEVNSQMAILKDQNGKDYQILPCQ